jgi:phosphoglycolate phosphatase
VDLDRMIEIVRNYYVEHIVDQTHLYPGIDKLLTQLARRGLPVAILTNKPHDATLVMVEALMPVYDFVAVEGYQQEAFKKPDPRTALGIVAKMNAEPGEVLMVGDSETDMATAVNTGLVPVGVTWGFRDVDVLEAAGVRHLIDRAEQLLDLL